MDTDVYVRVDSPYEYRTARADDWDDVVVLLSEAFNADIGEEWSANNRLVFEPGRALLATSPSGELAGMSAAYTRDVMTPGGRVAAAHVTMVAVSSVHHRRGILRTMISRLHDDALRRGDAVAVLRASEGRIYQRFGYGYAVAQLTMEIDTREVSLLPSATPGRDGSVRKAALCDLDPLVTVFDQVVGGRPGWSSRSSTQASPSTRRIGGCGRDVRTCRATPASSAWKTAQPTASSMFSP